MIILLVLFSARQTTLTFWYLFSGNLFDLKFPPI